MLTILSYSGHGIYLCRCKCGREKPVAGCRLRNGHTSSCGCNRRNRKHLKSRSRVFQVWANMKDRCLNPQCASYKGYGARGIDVCDRWLSFENFFADMGEPPQGMSLDRKENDLGYSPDNCRWASFKTQSNNRRNSVHLSMGGRTQTMAQWAEEFSLPRWTVHRRLKAGWSLEKSLTTPPDQSKASRRKSC